MHEMLPLILSALLNTITARRKSPQKTPKSFTVAVDTEGFTELKVVVENIGKLPSWHPAAGEDAWLFVDEVLFW